MNQVTAVIYQPGAYGSFVSWMIERTNKIRQQHPGIPDDPLLPDGSSHGYASFCKVKDNDDFISGLNDARWSITPWHTVIYAGWPAGPDESISVAVRRVLDWMNAFDKIIYVSCTKPDHHYLRYLRNETTMDKTRWYGMIAIDDDAGLHAALERDLSAMALDPVISDPRLMRISIDDLLYTDKERFVRRLLSHLGWPICDMGLAEDTLVRMRLAQQLELLRLQRAKDGNASSPAMTAVRDSYQQRKGN